MFCGIICQVASLRFLFEEVINDDIFSQFFFVANKMIMYFGFVNVKLTLLYYFSKEVALFFFFNPTQKNVKFSLYKKLTLLQLRMFNKWSLKFELMYNKGIYVNWLFARLLSQTKTYLENFQFYIFFNR